MTTHKRKSLFERVLGGNVYTYSQSEKVGLEAVLASLKDAVILSMPLRERNGTKRYGIAIFTQRQLTAGLQADHAVLAILQGAYETEESFKTRVESYGIDWEDTIERIKEVDDSDSE